MLSTWKKIKTEEIASNPYWSYRKDTCILPNGQEGEYHYVQTGGSVNILPIDSEGKIICVRQYRYLFDRESLEFPGGGIEKNQTPEQAAKIELAEEAKVSAGEIKKIGALAAIAGFSNETMHVFLAQDLRPVAAGQDQTEEFVIEKLTPEQIDIAIQKGEIFNAFAVSAWALARPHLK